jgi:hypothetical protein
MTKTVEDVRLLARAAEWAGSEAAPEARRLEEIVRSEGLGFATALLHEQLLKREENARFLQQAQAAGSAAKIDVDLIGVVPGAFHREHRHTGADGARILRIAEELGCAAEVIPTGSFGTFEENARAIGAWLAAHRGQHFALLSLSKGSADLKYALAQPGAMTAFANVTTWVSLSGMVQGTPLVAWLRQRWLRWWSVRLLLWWRGHSGRALKELNHGPGTVLAGWPVLPPHLRVVHVYGFPLEQHLTHPWASKGYARVAPLGPNDGGGILLSDLAALPGIVCPIWGADHYLEPAWDVLPLLRGIVISAVAGVEPRQASQSASTPSMEPATRSIT